MKISRVLKMAALFGAVFVLNGCAVATGAAIMGASAAVTNKAVDSTSQYAQRVRKMNCAQLRTENAKLQKDSLGKVNPFGGWAVRHASVQDAASARRCLL